MQAVPSVPRDSPLFFLKKKEDVKLPYRLNTSRFSDATMRHTIQYTIIFGKTADFFGTVKACLDAITYLKRNLARIPTDKPGTSRTTKNSGLPLRHFRRRPADPTEKVLLTKRGEAGNLASTGTGKSFNGRTHGSGPWNRGSSPCFPANLRVSAAPPFSSPRLLSGASV